MMREKREDTWQFEWNSHGSCYQNTIESSHGPSRKCSTGVLDILKCYFFNYLYSTWETSVAIFFSSFHSSYSWIYLWFEKDFRWTLYHNFTSSILNTKKTIKINKKKNCYELWLCLYIVTFNSTYIVVGRM